MARPAFQTAARPNKDCGTHPWYPDRLIWSAQASAADQEMFRRELARLARYAPHVPMLAAALDWAAGHGIAFMVDRGCQAGGYYTVGSGVVVLAGNALGDPARAIEVLVHELRHAWQDYYGMIPTQGRDFANSYIHTALIEADAYAHGQLAQRQFRDYAWVELMVERGAQRPAAGGMSERRRRAAEPQHLAASFREWFSGHRAQWYGEHAARHQGVKWGVPGVTAQSLNIAFRKSAVHVETPGIDLARMEDVQRLGKSFQGHRYLQSEAMRDFLAKTALSPGQAKRFYGVRQMPLVAELERRQRRLARHKAEKAI